ncbi:putative phosphatase PhoE [Insulibacter thermoxylanivorax]|uniref:Phosphatase PhoE n=2 Tax=Insulibacter thermoxylanivorax TaxID=2749268 RepID=A0A916QE85_9BACL|nr:putative phosphatase PhoE [Insulibacter thermoxylanivorax]
MTILGLIRHGVTDWNAAGKIQGQTDIPLNSEGRRQAEVLADWLQQDGIPWDAIYSSDLQRAYKTASIIADTLQLPQVQIDPRIRERSFGHAEGLTAEERVARYGESLEGAGMEAEERIIARGKQFLDDLLSAKSGKRILIVSHGGFLKRFNKLLIPDLPDAYIDNASLTIVKQEGNGWALKLHNFVAHRIRD